jgi:PAS domain S-box-containing protein
MSKKHEQEQEQETHPPVKTGHNGFAATDGSDLNQINARLQQQIERMRRYNEALLHLAAQDASPLDLNERLEQITQAIGQTLDVERVGIWLYDEKQTKIECVKLYEHSPGRFSDGLELTAADYPNYFQALQEEFTIDADDAWHDPRTSEFTENYLKPLGITSMLDLPIQRGDLISGVICLEHVGPLRRWDDEEKSFAASAANQVALALERHNRIQVETNLRESQRVLNTLMGNLPGMVYRCRNDENWTMEFVSSGAAVLTGYQPDELIGNRLAAYADLIHPEDQDRVWQVVQQHLSQQRPFTLTYRLRTAENQEKWVWEQGGGIFSAKGDLLGLEGFVIDISEQERTNIAFAQSEQRFRILAENVPGVIYLCNNDERYTMDFINNQVEDLTGYSAEAFLNDEISFVELYHPDDVAVIEEEVGAALAEGRSFSMQYRIKHRNGEWRWVEEVGSGIYGESGELLFLEGILNNITRRLDREETLRRSQELMQNVVNNAPIIIFAIDRDGTFTLSDGKQLAMLGLQPGQVVGLSAFDVYQEVPEIIEHIKQTLAGTPTQYEAVVGDLAFETWLEPIYDGQGEVNGLVGVAVDVTEARQASHTLETRLRYEHGLSLASQALLTPDETAVPQTLEHLREAANACRAYLFEIKQDPQEGPVGRQIYEICAPGVTPYIDDPSMQHVPLRAAGLQRWLDYLPQGQPINNIAVDMPESEQEILIAQQVQAILLLPIIINGQWQAIIGFDNTKNATQWATEDVQLLQTAAGMIGAYMERQQASRMLQSRVRYEHGLSLASQTLLSATSDKALSEALTYLREATHTSRAYFFENFMDEELGLCQRQLYEACAPGVEPQIDMPELQRMSYEQSGLGRWADVMAEGQFINSAAADLPSPEDEVIASFGIKAILLLPVFVQDRWHGFIGFDKIDDAEAWSEADAQLLQTAAHLFGAYLERTQLYSEIEGSLHLREAQVRVAAQAAREIAGMPDLNQLYERIVTLIKEEFGYYHVQLLRYDPTLDNVGLVVGYGEVGTEMLAMNHSLPMGVGVIGKAAAEGRSVLLADVREDPNWKPNSLLPDTQSELAVPIKVGDEVLGVIDVQSDRLGSLTPADQLLLDGLCGQLAIAIESTRLRQDMEIRLRELDTLQRFMSRSGWDTYHEKAQRLPGYLFHRGDVQPLSDEEISHTRLLKQFGLSGSEADLSTNGQGKPAPRMQSLTVRGETIGQLVVEDDGERPLTTEEESFLQSVSEQVAEALEAARLFEQTQVALAEQERLSSELATVAQVSTAASTILEAEALLQAAVDLAQISFNLTHAHIYLYDRDNKMLALRAGAGDTGRLMTLEGRNLDLNASSLVARAARDREGALSNDVQKTLEFVPHPMLASTRSELAIPMIVGGSLIGVLDLLSDQADRFSEQDTGIFNTLASQVAVAVQNAQLYAEQVATAEELRKIDQLKSEFLASMSHELRTPLNSIIGFADVLLEGIDGELNERMEEDVRLIRESGSHLRALIGDILDMSKIEAGMMEIRHQALEINQLAEDVVATAMPLAQEKDLYLNLEVADKIPTIYADHTRIRQVLWNIVGNAIKFTQEGGVTMNISLSKEDDLLVRVSDTGVGIRKNDLEVVFEQFRQVGGELNTSSSGGTGLGLPISKKLIELHGGTIWVESIVGEGTTFFFTLPIGLPPAKVTKPKTGPLSFLS